MKNKIISLSIVMLMISICFNIGIPAGSEEDPEIEDEIGDAFGYIDIESVWFYEKSDEPDVLYVCMKIINASYTTFQQTFAVFWEYKNVKYAVSLHLGFSFKNWSRYTSGVEGRWDYINDPIEGDYDFDTGISYAESLNVLKSKIRKGSIIVLHDRPGSSAHKFLDQFIGWTLECGYRFVPLP